MPKPKSGGVQTSAPAEEPAPDPRAGALRQTLELNPSTNEASPRTAAERRPEPGHAPEAAPAASTDHPKE